MPLLPSSKLEHLSGIGPGARPSRAWHRHSVNKEGLECSIEIIIPDASGWSSHALRASSQRLWCRCSDCMLPHDQGFPFRQLPCPTLKGAAGSASNTSHVRSLPRFRLMPRTPAQLCTCAAKRSCATRRLHAEAEPRRCRKCPCFSFTIISGVAELTPPSWVQILRAGGKPSDVSQGEYGFIN